MISVEKAIKQRENKLIREGKDRDKSTRAEIKGAIKVLNRQLKKGEEPKICLNSKRVAMQVQDALLQKSYTSTLDKYNYGIYWVRVILPKD